MPRGSAREHRTCATTAGSNDLPRWGPRPASNVDGGRTSVMSVESGSHLRRSAAPPVIVREQIASEAPAPRPCAESVVRPAPRPPLATARRAAPVRRSSVSSGRPWPARSRVRTSHSRRSRPPRPAGGGERVLDQRRRAVEAPGGFFGEWARDEPVRARRERLGASWCGPFHLEHPSTSTRRRAGSSATPTSTGVPAALAIRLNHQRFGGAVMTWRSRAKSGRALMKPPRRTSARLVEIAHRG